MSTHAIEVTDLHKNFGRLRAVDGLSFTVDYGKVVGFIGPNGAGKTTALRSIVGHIRPASGTVHVAGRLYSQLPDPLATVGTVLEAGAVHPGRSGRNHLRILARQAGLSRRRVDEVIATVGLESAARRRVGGYSLGMRQRLAVAAALLGDPAVLILDEPANGLDPEGVKWLREFLRSLADEGRAILVASHGLAELALTVDEVVVIAHGTLITQRPLADLALDAGRPRVLVTASDPDRLETLLTQHGHEIVSRSGGTLTVAGPDARPIGRLAIQNDIDLDQLTVDHPSLEEAYFHLTAGKESIR